MGSDGSHKCVQLLTSWGCPQWRQVGGLSGVHRACWHGGELIQAASIPHSPEGDITIPPHMQYLTGMLVLNNKLCEAGRGFLTTCLR